MYFKNSASVLAAQQGSFTPAWSSSSVLTGCSISMQQPISTSSCTHFTLQSSSIMYVPCAAQCTTTYHTPKHSAMPCEPLTEHHLTVSEYGMCTTIQGTGLMSHNVHRQTEATCTHARTRTHRHGEKVTYTGKTPSQTTVKRARAVHTHLSCTVDAAIGTAIDGVFRHLHASLEELGRLRVQCHVATSMQTHRTTVNQAHPHWSSPVTYHPQYAAPWVRAGDDVVAVCILGPTPKHIFRETVAQLRAE